MLLHPQTDLVLSFTLFLSLFLIFYLETFLTLPPPHPAHTHPRDYRHQANCCGGFHCQKMRGEDIAIITAYFTPGDKKKRDGSASNICSYSFINYTFYLKLYCRIIYFRRLMGILTDSIYHLNHQGYFIKISRWQNLQ